MEACGLSFRKDLKIGKQFSLFMGSSSEGRENQYRSNNNNVSLCKQGPESKKNFNKNLLKISPSIYKTSNNHISYFKTIKYSLKYMLNYIL